MSEQQQFEGDRWTKQSIKLLSELGWKQVGDSNFDIKCSKKREHSKNENRERKNDHGIDALFTYFDPFLAEDNGILVESKSRIWSNINKSNLQNFVKQTLDTVECANVSKEIQELECPTVDRALILVWCKELDNYQQEDFKGYLSNLEVPKRRKAMTIYIASNYDILRWCSLVEHTKQIKMESNVVEFQFYYPGDNFGNRKSIPKRRNHLNLTFLFSSYIFAKSKEKRTFYNDVKQIDVNHVFFFAEATLDELKFMYDLIKDFQFQDADELHIHFYGEQTNYRTHIQQFLRTEKEKLKRDGSLLILKERYMNVLKDVPASYNQMEE